MEDYLIQYTDESLQDLRDIYDYISTDLKSPEVSAAQIKRIRDEIRSQCVSEEVQNCRVGVIAIS